jgi:hypothetical protein
MRALIALIGVLGLTACAPVTVRHDDGVQASAPVARAVEYSTVDLGACLRIARNEEKPAETRCPGFISQTLPGSVKQCADAGGRLAPVRQPTVWSLDVDFDGRPEFLFDVSQNFDCVGAWSVLSCGSLGCPSSLYQFRNGVWESIGVMSMGDAPRAEVLAPAKARGYAVLRGGCSGDRPCEELTYFSWNGASYEGKAIDVRGAWVDPGGGGLWTLVRDVVVRATPAPDAGVLDHYPAGTEMVVLGKARAGAYYYASPCNACRSGFVEVTALRKMYP